MKRASLDCVLAGGANDDPAVRELAGRRPLPSGKRALQVSVLAVSRSEYGTDRVQRRLDHRGQPTRLRWTGYFVPMRLADAISLRSRRRKLRLFLDELQPTAETSVLDVGADELAFGEGDGCRTLNFFEEHYPWPERITALGLQDGESFRARYPGIRYVQGDACALPFADGEFDVVFSNAVIEHVGGRERQQRFVSEALRVGRSVFVTTPNRRFPVEVHTRLPLVHWLPDSLSHPRRTGRRGRTPPRMSGSSRGAAFAALFPGRVRIVNLGLTLVAIVD